MAVGRNVLILLVSVIIGIVYAARRRTMMREQLGIAGVLPKRSQPCSLLLAPASKGLLSLALAGSGLQFLSANDSRRVRMLTFLAGRRLLVQGPGAVVLLRAVRALPGAHLQPCPAPMRACPCLAPAQRGRFPSFPVVAAQRRHVPVLTCAPAAQETRTLAFNNVRGGTWHGPTRFILPAHEPAPMAAPLVPVATTA